MSPDERLKKQRHGEVRCVARTHTAGRKGQRARGQGAHPCASLPACQPASHHVPREDLRAGTYPKHLCPSSVTETGERIPNIPPPGCPPAQPGQSHLQLLVSRWDTRWQGQGTSFSLEGASPHIYCPKIYSCEMTDRPPSQSAQTIYSFHTLGLQEKARMGTGAPPHCYTL